MRPSSSGDLAVVLRSQNGDGGWSYRGGRSWTEPTVYALLALAAEKERGDSFRRGCRWLHTAQRSDGGWPPCPAVDQSTWVTALVLLLPADGSAAGDRARALAWLLEREGRESGLLHRLNLLLLGQRDLNLGHAGWPWYPGAAAWVSPTCLTVLALQKSRAPASRAELPERIESARRFLIARMCSDGGWNHGGSRALGYEAGSYPETTGQALLALHGVVLPDPAKNVAKARWHLERCRSAEGRGWLVLGLLAQGVAPEPLTGELRCHTVLDTALTILARAAAAGRNLFLS